MKLVASRLLNGASNVNDVQAIDLSRLGLQETTHTLDWGVGVSAGAVIIEAAGSHDYPGTWQPLQTVTFSSLAADGVTPEPAPKQKVINITGDYAAIRHRVTSPVLDGTVSSRIDGSGAW